MSKHRKRILLVIQRASDFTEICRAIEYLSKRNYECIILFYGVGNKEADSQVLDKIREAKERGVIRAAIVKYPPSRGLDRYSKIFPGWFFLAKRPSSKETPPLEPSKIDRPSHRYSLKWFLTAIVIVIELPFFILYLVSHAVLKFALLIKFMLLGESKQFHSEREFNIFLNGFILKTRISFIDQIKKGHCQLKKGGNQFRKILLMIGQINQLNKLTFHFKKWIELFDSKINKNFGSYFAIVFLFILNSTVFHKIIKKLKINLIVLPEDIVGLVTPLIVRAGHRNNVPSLIIPYTISNQEEAFQSLKSASAFSASFYPNKLIGFLFPKWRKKDDSHVVLRLPGPYVLGHIISLSSPPDPWMMNSGYANAIAVENEAMRQYYLKSGISKNKLKVTGSFCDDDIANIYLNKAEELRKVSDALGIEINKPILLIGGCPNQLVGHPPGFDFENMEDMVTFIVKNLESYREKYHLLIRPHPNFPALGDMFEAHGWMTTQLDTIKLIPLADIYIAFASATIRWAIASSVPVINYDVFHYDFSDYKKTQGVMNVRYPSEFTALVNQLRENDFLTLQRQKIAVDSKIWGMLDGFSANRICNLMEELMKLNPVPRIAG